MHPPARVQLFLALLQVREAILKELPATWTGCLHCAAVHVGHTSNMLPAKDKVRAVKIIERDDDAEGGGEWSGSARTFSAALRAS